MLLPLIGGTIKYQPMDAMIAEQKSFFMFKPDAGIHYVGLRSSALLSSKQDLGICRAWYDLGHLDAPVWIF
jgi:hypothetical protein